MNQLIIRKISIVDYENEVANSFEFSERNNLIVSEQNGQGKSSLVKSIYYGLGCKLNSFPKNWEPQKYIIQLYVLINGESYIIKRHNKVISIKGSEESLIFNNFRDYSEWLQIKLGMSLKLTSRDINEQRFAYIDALMSPFYVDQDKGWNGTLYRQTFDGVGQYSSSIFPKDVIDYFLGISNEELNNKKIQKEDFNIKRRLLLEKISQVEAVYNSYQERNDIVDYLPKDIEELEIEIDYYIRKTNEISLEIQRVTKKIEKTKLELDIHRQDKNELELLLKDNSKHFENIKHECSYCHSILTREQSLTRLELEDNRLAINSFKELIVGKISQLETSLSEKQSTLYVLREKVHAYQRQIDEINEIKDIKNYISQSVLAELGKLIHEELYKKEILDNEIGQLEKDIKRLNSELVLCIRSLEGDFERLKNSLSSLISSNGLANRRFRDYKKINGSGTNLNKDLLAIYLIYMNLIASNSDFKFPFAIDSFVKNEIDTISQEKMFSAISSYFLTLETQTFFSVIRENLDKISGDYCEIRVESPLLKADKYEDVSREIIEYGD
jgi:conserved hypothetical protein